MVPIETSETSETEKKVAAAEAAQLTATTAQGVADDFKKVADEAVEADKDPLVETAKINLREQAEELMKTTIHSLRKLNTPKE